MSHRVAALVFCAGVVLSGVPAAPCAAESARKPCDVPGVCVAYVEQVRSQLAENWERGPESPAGHVRLRFGIDRSGRAFVLDVLGADSGPLARGCVAAFHKAEPFTPPPAGLEGQVFVVTFEFASQQASRDTAKTQAAPASAPAARPD